MKESDLLAAQVIAGSKGDFEFVKKH